MRAMRVRACVRVRGRSTHSPLTAYKVGQKYMTERRRQRVRFRAVFALLLRCYEARGAVLRRHFVN